MNDAVIWIERLQCVQELNYFKTILGYNWYLFAFRGFTPLFQTNASTEQ